MDTFKQFHVARRLTPVLGSLASAAGSGSDLTKAIVPIADAISSMADADCDYILHACLNVVKLDQGNNTWSPIFSNGLLMFQEIDMATMLQIAVKVIQDNLSGFFQGAAGAITTQATVATV